MNTNKIGLNATQVKDGMKVYYYPWVSKEDGNHAAGIETTIKGDCYFQNDKYCCFVNGIRGYVLISHLSTEFYPEHYVKKTVQQKNYEKYLDNDGYYSFSEFLGIERPKLATNYMTGFYRYESAKYPFVKGDYFRFKKDAKKDYKEKLRAYLKSSKP